ncbi:MAG: hypothetical protein KJO95_08165 [Gammaproteobacteria bacterium]|nr:hypothetical protein [Gammaproteobacteria bacterium]
MEAEATFIERAFWAAYDVLAPVAAAALTWAVAWLTGLVRARLRNDYVDGMTRRLNDSIEDAVDAVNQQLDALLAAAKLPRSPGGKRLTATEARTLKRAAVEQVRSYWGAKGLKELAKILGFGGGEHAAHQLHTVIDNKIEAAVYRRKTRPQME